METPPLERKLAAILAADVEGYSRLMHADEERTLTTLTGHRKLVDDLIERAGGQIFGTAGDSVLAEFTSVVHAFGCAVAIQQTLRRANADLPEDERMHLRIGINVGDVMVKDGDIFGDGVNIAARLESLAASEGICVTRGVRDHLRDRADAVFEDLGEHSVKNIARPVRVFRAQFDIDAEPVVVAGPVLPGSAAPALDATVPAIVTAPAGDAVEIAFWESLQANDDVEEYRIYLERYPEGAFADLARARVESATAAPEPKPTTEAEPVVGEDPQIEVTFWETVRDGGSRAMLEAYVKKYPGGRFIALAEIMLAESA